MDMAPTVCWIPKCSCGETPPEPSVQDTAREATPPAPPPRLPLSQGALDSVLLYYLQSKYAYRMWVTFQYRWKFEDFLPPMYVVSFHASRDLRVV